MTKVWCAEIACKHNNNNRCAAKEINLSAGRIHTVHEGVAHKWECRSFEESEISKEITEQMRAFMKNLEE